MNLDNREVHHNMYLSERELNQFYNYCKVIATTLKQCQGVVHVWYNLSLSSEAVYFHVRTTCGRTILFSIRNHTSRAVKRQHNFFLSDYERLIDMRKVITEWVKCEMNKS